MATVSDIPELSEADYRKLISKALTKVIYTNFKVDVNMVSIF
jgi:hypothetical protein